MSTSNALYSEKVSPALSSLLHNPVEAPLRQKPYMVVMISESKLAVVRASLSRFVTWQHSDFIGADNAGLHIASYVTATKGRTERGCKEVLKSLKICVACSHGLRR